MSHIVDLDLAVKNLDDLERACEFIGTIELKRNQKQFKYYGGSLGKCAHAISVIGKAAAYELGLIDNKDGSFNLAGDFYGGGNGLELAVGKNAERLKQEYAAQVSIRHLKRKGFRSIKRKVELNGTLTLVGER